MKFEELEVYIPKRIPHNYKDLTNTENEYFKIISRAPNKNNRPQWNCQCKTCGEYCVKDRANLFVHKSCGCAKNKNIGKSLRKDLTNKKFGKLTAIKDTGKSNASGNAIWLCKCDCGNECEVDSNNLSSLHTYSCGCVKYSIGERNIIKILDNNNISYVKEYSLKNINNQHPYRFDFALLDNDNNIQRFIEFDGIQHYQETHGLWKHTKSDLKQLQQRDKVKNEYALSHNIPLVRIPYWERDNITLDMIMGDKYLVRELGQPIG